MTRRRLPHVRLPHPRVLGPRPARRAPVIAVGLLVLAVAGCARAVEGLPATSPTREAPTPDLPDRAEELEPLVVTSVPSGLPRLPDGDVSPPAGAKSVDDVASYAPDPSRERDVLGDYGYRFGWERLWGRDGGPMTSVFVDQFETRQGAAEYAADLAANEAELHGGTLHRHPARWPDGCRVLTVAVPRPEEGAMGPAVFAWCGHGVFSVGVTAVATSVEAASEEVRTVLQAQLDRLPSP